MGAKDPPKPPAQFSVLPKVINGGIAGIVGVSCVFPIDLVKTRLQNQTTGKDGKRQYSSMLDCFKKTYAAEGYFGMYRGSAVNIILVTPEKAIKLASNDYFRYYFTGPDGTIPISRQIISGGMAGCAAGMTLTTPMELLKIQLQDAGRVAAEAKKAGKAAPKITAMSVASKLIKEKGIGGLWKGVAATTVREWSFCLIYFPLFAVINSATNPDPTKPPPFWCSFVAGLGAGSVAAFLVTPVDVIKTRMQTLTVGAKQYSSIVDCLSTTVKNEGFTALYKGGACRMMVIAPLFAIAQTVYYFAIAETLLGLK
ncbi:mitochondrial glutamate carrier 1-like [Plodia interpunctella]|uniref:mitochondrial glutamate carrier 1-like n=1 Tax=Plodia interpunctella TaxID=58824 RepID=UPI0023674A02|nr:mitochondrial glutamate carrier 1-like [Plodia interpunctella]